MIELRQGITAMSNEQPEAASFVNEIYLCAKAIVREQKLVSLSAGCANWSFGRDDLSENCEFLQGMDDQDHHTK